jgi:hypothetical protein
VLDDNCAATVEAHKSTSENAKSGNGFFMYDSFLLRDNARHEPSEFYERRTATGDEATMSITQQSPVKSLCQIC